MRVMLTFCSEIMAGFFEDCVSKILDLIEGHVRQIDQMDKRAMVGSKTTEAN